LTKSRLLGIREECFPTSGQLDLNRFQHVLTYDFLDQVIDLFLDPPSYPPTTTPAARKSDVSRLAGLYRSNRFSHGTLAKLATLFSQLPVTATDRGTLIVPGPFTPVEVSPLGDNLFQSFDRGTQVVFEEDGRRGTTRIFLPFFGPTAFHRLAWYERWDLHAMALLAASLVLLCEILLLPMQRRLGGWDPLATPAAVALACLNFAFVAYMYQRLQGDLIAFAYEVPWDVKLALLLPIGAAAMTSFVLWRTIGFMLTRNRAPLWCCVHHLFSAAAGLLFLLLFNSWNLLGFRY